MSAFFGGKSIPSSSHYRSQATPHPLCKSRSSVLPMLTNQTDWFRVLADLRDCGLTHCDVARQINIPRSRVRGWYAGTAPRFDDGVLLMLLWLQAGGLRDQQAVAGSILSLLPRK